MKERIIASWLLVALVAVIFARDAIAVPPIPQGLYGTVKVDDQNVPEGTVIQGYCDGVVYGGTTSSFFQGESIYNIDVFGDDPETAAVKEGCYLGELIVLTIGELTANETAIWTGGSAIEVNLTAESPRPELTLNKYTNDIDVSAAPGPYILSGDPITWTYIISNTGNVVVDNVVLTDDNGTPNDQADDIEVCQFGSISPPFSETCSHLGVAGIGQYTNTATVTAFYTNTISAMDASYYFGAITSIDVEKHTNGYDADLVPGLYLPQGEPITWTYTVTNNSNVDLSGVTITDDNGTPGVPGDDFEVCNFALMVPSQSESCSHPGGSASTGNYSNIATAVGTPPPDLLDVSDEDPSNYFGVDSSITLVKSTNGQDADLPPGPLVRLGTDVLWNYQVDNTSNVTLTNVTVTDNLVAGISCQSDVLGPGEAMICEATALADHLGQYMNLGSVTGLPPGGLAMVTDTNPSHYYGVEPSIDIEKATNGEDADLSPGPFILEGDPITWTYTITNTGNVTLTNIVVTDPVVAVAQGQLPDTAICIIPEMGIGDPPVTCEVLSTAEIGQHSNTATANADVWAGLGTVSDSDTSHYFGSGPGIQIEKLTNDEDADSAPGPYILVGDAVTWTYIISNTGNISLTNLVVSDDQLGQICVIPNLTPFAPPATCDAAGSAVEGQYANLGIVTAEVWGGLDPISATDASHYFGAITTINLEKLTNNVDADSAPGPYILVDDPVTWTFKVQNTGNITLTSVHVVDDYLTGLDCQVAALGVDEELTCQVQEAAVTGQHSNLATAFGTPPQLPEISDQDASHYYGAKPLIDINKTTNGLDADSSPGPYILENDAVIWTYTITNTGNVTLTNITITDDKDGLVCSFESLAPQDSPAPCTKASTAAEGQYENTGIVEAQYAGSFATVNISDTDKSHYFGAITTIDVEKHTNGSDADSAPGVYILVNDPLTWTFAITNTSNVTLTAITLTDSALGLIDCQKDSLTPLEGTECQVTDVAAIGQHENIASVTGTPPGGLPDATDNDYSHYYGANPIINVQKYTNGDDADSEPGPYILVNDPVTWTYSVGNSGNVDLSGVMVIDDNGTPGILDDDWTCPIGDLAVGVVDTSCSNLGSAIEGQFGNLATVEGSPPGGLSPVKAEDPSHYFGSRPGVTITKLTNGVDADSGTGPFILVGDPVTWTFVITNSGNVTLTNIIVTDDNGTPAIPGDDKTSQDLGSLQAGSSTVFNMPGFAMKGQYTNVGYVLGKPLVGGDVQDNNASSYFGSETGIEIETFTNGLDSDSPRGEFIEVGEAITWTYVISNTSNVTLTEVVVTDDNGTPGDPNDDIEVCSYEELEPGQLETCFAYGVAIKGQYANIGKVTGSPPDNLPIVTDSDPSHYYGYIPAPGIEVDKLLNGSETGPIPGVFILVGESITWTFDIINSGNVSLTDIILVDDNGTPDNPLDDIDVCQANELAPFSSFSCELVDVVAEGQFGNTAVVSGTFDSQTFSDMDSSYYYGSIPAVEIQKYTNSQDADSGTGPILVTGETVTWTYIISNTGNVTLTDLIVEDNQIGVICEPDALVPGQPSVQCQSTGTVEFGQYANRAVVTGYWPTGEMISADDWSHYFGLQRLYLPAILKG